MDESSNLSGSTNEAEKASSVNSGEAFSLHCPEVNDGEVNDKGVLLCQSSTSGYFPQTQNFFKFGAEKASSVNSGEAFSLHCPEVNDGEVKDKGVLLCQSSTSGYFPQTQNFFKFGAEKASSVNSGEAFSLHCPEVNDGEVKDKGVLLCQSSTSGYFPQTQNFFKFGAEKASSVNSGEAFSLHCREMNDGEVNGKGILIYRCSTSGYSFPDLFR